MSRVLVTGASGLLGLSLCLDLARDHEVVAVSRGRLVHHPGVAARQVDLTDLSAVRELWAGAAPDVVVHAAALTSIETCEEHPDLARRLNADVTEEVARQCRDRGTRLLHVSTDAVFDGSDGPYSEADATGPLSVYGQTKLEAEGRCLDACPDALVARVNFFGWSAGGDRSLAEFFITALRAGRPVGGFTDVLFSPLYQRDLGDLLMAAVETRITGVRHAGGPDVLSKYQFGRLVAETFALDPELVQSASVAELSAGRVRSPRLALDSSRLARETGRALPTVRSGLRRMRADEGSGRVGELRRALTSSHSTLTDEAEQ